MSDILFTRKLGSSVVTRPQVTNATSAVPGTLSNVPSGLLNEGVGSLIKALVVSQNSRGIATLETDKGLLTLQTNFPLKTGAQLTLQLQSIGAQTRVVILSVDDSPPVQPGQHPDPSSGNALARQAGKGAAAVKSDTSTVTSKNDQSPTRPGVSDTIVPNPTPSQSRAAGTTAQLHHYGSHDAIRAGLVLPGNVISVAGQRVGPGTGGNTLSAGDNLIVRILRIGNPSPGLVGSNPPVEHASNQALKGVVVDVAASSAPSPAPKNSDGPPHLPHPQQTILATPSARIALSALPPGPAGTEVLFEVLDSGPSARAEGTSVRSALTDFVKLATDWKSIKEVSAIAFHEPGAPASSAAINAIPRPGAAMGSSMLFFIAALKVGDIGAWLGTKAIEQLTEQGHSQLMSRLAADFGVVARHASDGYPNGWHALAIPINLEDHLAQIRMYYRRNGHSQDAANDESSTRFIVEAELSRFGLFQMDGLIKKARFDLIIRSQSALGADVQGDIRNIFSDALTLGTLSGTIRFNAGLTIPFRPLDGELENIPHGAGMLV